MAPLDYSRIGLTLLAQAPSLLGTWLPGGKLQGKYFKCGSIQGGPGDSFLVNLETGLWGEFNGTGQKGKDLIDLYAAINNMTNHDAAIILQQTYLGGSGIPVPSPTVQMQETKPKEVLIIKPPKDAPKPSWGSPSKTWLYRDTEGDPLFYISRFDRPGKSKMILPWGWDGTKWVSKHYPAPRPLYGLELLSKAPKNAVLLVEGEKACDAARTLLGSIYVVMTWPGGAGAVEKINWKPLEGRRILLWPDADEPGTKAMLLIASKIAPITTEIKILNPLGKPNAKAEGWDADDAVKSGWTQADIITWAKERLTVLSNNGSAVAPPPKSSNVEYMVKERPETVQQVEDVTDQVQISQGLTVKWLNIGLATTSKGTPIYNEENVLRIFERDDFFKEFIWFDEFHKRYFTKWGDSSINGHVRTWKDEVDFFRITSYLQRRWGLSKISVTQVNHATIEYANQHVKNEPLDWINSLEWDGQSRIESCFSECFGVLPSRYTYDVSKNFFLALAARINDPGCKFDNMVVLEGKQETYKSTSLAILGGSWYASIRHQIGSPNFFNAIQGKWLVEIAEMDSFSNSQNSAIKDFLSNPVDRFRIPYRPATEDFPRVCVFAGTTNQRTYLSDMTGLRRFWTIATHGINLKYLKENREQLFAEAQALYHKGTPWHIVDKKEQAKEAEERRQQDPWEEIIQGFAQEKREVGVLSSELFSSECLNIPKERQDMKVLKRLGGIMHFLGWETKNQAGGDGVQRKVWYPVEKKISPIEVIPAHTPTPTPTP